MIFIYIYIRIYIYIYTHSIHGAGIYANIWCILMVNVTIYSIHGSHGIYIYIYIHILYLCVCIICTILNAELILAIWVWVNTYRYHYFSGLFTSILTQLWLGVHGTVPGFWHTAISLKTAISYMVQYLHFRILKFPLTIWCYMPTT